MELYNPDVVLPGDHEESDESADEQLLESRDQKNYVQEFFTRWGKLIVAASPEFWHLMLYDMLRELCDPKCTNRELELKFFELLKSAEPVQFLLTMRKNIVAYLSHAKFWERRQGEQATNTNYQVLKAIGIDSVEEAAKLGLGEADLGKSKRRQRDRPQAEDLAATDP